MECAKLGFWEGIVSSLAHPRRATAVASAGFWLLRTVTPISGVFSECQRKRWSSIFDLDMLSDAVSLGPSTSRFMVALQLSLWAIQGAAKLQPGDPGNEAHVINGTGGQVNAMNPLKGHTLLMDTLTIRHYVGQSYPIAAKSFTFGQFSEIGWHYQAVAWQMAKFCKNYCLYPNTFF